MRTETLAIIEVISKIPEGRVMTYGQVGSCAGIYNGARQVVWALRAYSQKYRLPWHRVINSRGYISLKDSEGSCLQRKLLEAEGIEISMDGRVDLARYRFNE